MSDKDKGKIVGIRPDLNIDPENGEEVIEPDEDLVEMLDLLLQQAKEGTLQECCFILRYDNLTTTASGFAGMPLNPTLVMGEMLRLQRRYQDFADEIEFGIEFDDDEE